MSKDNFPQGDAPDVSGSQANLEPAGWNHGVTPTALVPQRGSEGPLVGTDSTLSARWMSD